MLLSAAWPLFAGPRAWYAIMEDSIADNSPQLNLMRSSTDYQLLHVL